MPAIDDSRAFYVVIVEFTPYPVEWRWPLGDDEDWPDWPQFPDAADLLRWLGAS